MTVILAVTSDVHCGGTTALCPDRIALDDGGEYVASKAQRWIFQCWRDYWTRVAQVKQSHKGARLYQVFNGDLVDGAHHHTTQILSGNPNAQAAVVNAAMAVPLAMKPDRIFIVRRPVTLEADVAATRVSATLVEMAKVHHKACRACPDLLPELSPVTSSTVISVDEEEDDETDRLPLKRRRLGFTA